MTAQHVLIIVMHTEQLNIQHSVLRLQTIIDNGKHETEGRSLSMETILIVRFYV